MRVVAVVASVVVVGLATTALAEERRAAVVSLEPGGNAAISTVKKRLVSAGFVVLGEGDDRDALEQELPAAERPDLDRARTALAAAVTAFERFDFSIAREKLEDIDAAIGTWVGDADCRQLLAERRLLAGLVAESEQSATKAELEFRLAHRLDPSRTSLDARLYPPAVIELYARAVAENAKADASTVSVSDEPPAVSVGVDGEPLAEGGSIGQGPHWVTLSRPGFVARARVVVARGDSTKIAVDLTPLPRAPRLREIRRAAIQDPSQLEDLSAEIASVAELDRLVLVRARGDGVAESAVYDARKHALGEWSAVTEAAVRRPLAIAPTVESPAIDLVGGPAIRHGDSPWYRRWWGAGLLVAGAGAVVTGILYVSLRGEHEPTMVTVDQWCVEDCR